MEDYTNHAVLKNVIKYQNFELEYILIRSSKDENDDTISTPILAFHGFGREVDDFLIFQKLLRKGQVIFSFHLFQHGSSKFPENRIKKDSLQISEFKHLMGFVFKELKIGQFSLLAFSMGGKLALILTELFPQRVLSLMLIAPDGVKVNKFYQFISGNAFGRAIYQFTVRNPKPLHSITNLSLKMGFISNKLHQFVFSHTDTYETRKLVGEVWMIYRLFQADIAKVQNLINQHEIKTVLIYGHYDSVIKVWQGELLDAGLDGKSLHVLEQGHMLLNERTIEYIYNNDLWLK